VNNFRTSQDKTDKVISENIKQMIKNITKVDANKRILSVNNYWNFASYNVCMYNNKIVI